MKTFLNEEMKPFCDLTDEQMLAIIRAKIAGNCEIRNIDMVWVGTELPTIGFSYIYRTEPPKQLVIPWKVIKPEYKHAAMDADKKIFGYSLRPERHGTEWGGEGQVSLKCLTIDTDGIDWETSHVTRPEGV